MEARPGGLAHFTPRSSAARRIDPAAMEARPGGLAHQRAGAVAASGGPCRNGGEAGWPRARGAHTPNNATVDGPQWRRGLVASRTPPRIGSSASALSRRNGGEAGWPRARFCQHQRGSAPRAAMEARPGGLAHIPIGGSQSSVQSMPQWRRGRVASRTTYAQSRGPRIAARRNGGEAGWPRAPAPDSRWRVINPRSRNGGEAGWPRARWAGRPTGEDRYAAAMEARPGGLAHPCRGAGRRR